jgi:hypothetical protein
MKTENTTPKQIVNSKGVRTTVYVSVDKFGNPRASRLEGLPAGAPTFDSVQQLDHITPELAAQLAYGTFDPAPWLNENGDRVSEIAPGDDPNDYMFFPREAFMLNREPIDPDIKVQYDNPYFRTNPKLNDSRDATPTALLDARAGTTVTIDRGDPYTKVAGSDMWRSGDKEIPTAWIMRRFTEGAIVYIRTPADQYEKVNEFEFDGVRVRHFYIDNDSVRVEAEAGGIALETAYWNTDGTNDIIPSERKGSLADVTVALARYAKGD